MHIFKIIEKNCTNVTDVKGTFHARMGLIKDKNIKDLTGAEEIKKWWQEYTEELYKKKRS